jgi:hypothetical protein
MSMLTHKKFKSNSFVLIRLMLVSLFAIFFSFLSVTASQAGDYTTVAEDMTFSGVFEGSTVTFNIPALSVTAGQTLTITNAGSTDVTKVNVSIAGWVYGTNSFASGKPVSITMPKNLLSNSAIAYSNDGITWVRIPLVANMAAITNQVTGDGYTDGGANVTIYSYHLTTFGAHIFDPAPAPAAAAPVYVRQTSNLSFAQSLYASDTLSDPDGELRKTVDQIMKKYGSLIK